MTKTSTQTDSRTMKTRYKRAGYLLKGMYTDELTFNDMVLPQWIGQSDCFWYERVTKDAGDGSGTRGDSYRLVDARARTNEEAFDHAALAMGLAQASGEEVHAGKLPLQHVDMELHESKADRRTVKTVTFTAFNQRWSYATDTRQCVKCLTCPDEWEVSPDGRQAVFVKEHNLWLHDFETGDERALTVDGERYYRYGFTGNGWTRPFHNYVQARWSPDSKRVFTVQHDERKVDTLPVMHYVPEEGVRPVVKHYKLALPGDPHIGVFRLLCIDIETGVTRDANYRPVPDTRNGRGFFDSRLGGWSTDSRRAWFVDVERDYKTVRVVEFDTDSGETRVLLKETTETQINLMAYGDDYPTFVMLPESGELLWYSERTGWAHLYLYDLETGKLKNPVTQGEWVVRHLLHIDEKRREAYILAGGRDPEKNPYYCELCRVNIDTGELATLLAGDYDVVVANMKDCNVFQKLAIRTGVIGNFPPRNGISPTGEFIVATRTRVDATPVSLLLNRAGEIVFEVESSDVSALPDDWCWPEPVGVTAADGETALSAVIYRPSDFSSDTSYPVVLSVCCGPDFPSTPTGSFSTSGLAGMFYLPAAALAELGFIVVQLDTRGHAGRSKAFKDYGYGWLEACCDLDDIIAATEQLARRYPYMDLERIGINSSIGGPGPVQGLFKRPDFFKVGVSAMLHDSRLMTAPLWGEMYEGLPGPSAEHLYPEAFAGNFQGKLLLINGMLDLTTPPSIPFRVIEALQKAGKRFDMLFLPNLGHDVSLYVHMRIWDYFVEHLLQAELPVGFVADNKNLSGSVDMADDTGPAT